MNVELRTMKAMVKEWRKRVNEEIEGAIIDRAAEAEEGNELGFELSRGYIMGLKHALREGKILGEENGTYRRY